jgi:glycosyltransferase involved in cell wall biosynthesis
MRILHLIQRYYPARGGAESHLNEISAHLAALGHSVTVATTDALDFELFWAPNRRRIPADESWERGVRILRFPVRHLPAPQLAYPAWRRLLWILSAAPFVPVSALTYLSRFTPWVPDLWRWLDATDETFDLVAGMTICFEPLLVAGLQFAQRRDIPFVNYPLTHLGSGPQPGQDALSRFYTMRHQLALVKASDAVVAQTPAEGAFYTACGFPEQRIVVAGPGASPDAVLGGDGARFRKRHGLEGPVVLSIASMSYDKGSMHTVEAVRRLWQAGQAVELVLIGAVLEPFKRFLAGLPAEDRDRIRLLGAVDEDEKRDALAACTLLAMPSRTESFGIVYLEAWLYQKPVIGAKTWGVTDVISEGEDGLLIPFGDVPALAAAIDYLLSHPDEATAMGRRGEAKVYAQHTWARKVTLSEELYSRLAGP